MVDILLLTAFVMCKTEPPSCFSRKIDILGVVPFLQNRGEIKENRIKGSVLRIYL
jgi:hypothetical protein